MSYLSSITRLSNTGNLSGITRINVVRKADILTFPDPTGSTVYGTLTFNEGTGLVPWEVTLETPRNKSADNNTREGASKKKTLDFTIPKDRDDIRAMLELAERDEFVLVLTDGNGKQKIVGTPWAPMRFTFAHDSGAQVSDMNAYQCQFYYDGPDNEYFYPATLDAPPAGPAPVIVKYNGVAIASLTPGQVFNIESEFGFTDFYTSTTT